MSTKKISVITVCLNCEKTIERTIRSVACQNYTDFEYLIIDGVSTDRTLELAERYADYFKKRGIAYRILSEQDKGIYDAMNKAAQMAEGEWILYMNAGDTFYDRNTLDLYVKEMSDDLDVIYGDILITEDGKYKRVPSLDVSEFCIDDPIPHQASITRTEWVSRIRFDWETYRIGADYDLFLRMYTLGARFKRIDQVLAIFLMGGTSYKNHRRFQKDMYLSQQKNGLHNPRKLWMILVKKEIFYRTRDFGRIFLKPVFYAEQRGWAMDKRVAAEYGK